MNNLSLKCAAFAALLILAAIPVKAAKITDTTSKVTAATPTIGHPGTPLVISFEFAKSALRLTETTEAECAAIAQEMANYPGAKLHIDGFADAVGTDQVNETISEERARALRGHFIHHYGLSPDRIVLRAHGEHLPIASNASELGRRQNRVAVAQVYRLETNVSSSLEGYQPNL